MHILNFKSLLFLVSLLTTWVSAVAIDPTAEPTKAGEEIIYPDTWIAYDDLDTRTDLKMIELPNGNFTTPLGLSRAPIDVCTSVNEYGWCSLLDDIHYAADSLGNTIKELSDAHNCQYVSGFIGKSRIRYDYITRSENGKCDTTAPKETISGALFHYFQDVQRGAVCGNSCIRLSHRGSWKGYLKLAHVAEWNPRVLCAEGLSDFGQCLVGADH